MKIKNTLSISEARKKFFTIADEVQAPGTYYTLTERGRPKVVIVSAEKFETLVHPKANHAYLVSAPHEKAWVVSERPSFPYGSEHARKNTLFLLREAPKILYMDRQMQNSLYQAKELARAQLYIELIEKYGYPLYSVEVGRCVKIGGPESRRYVEADIVVNGREADDPLLLFSVAAFELYEQHKDDAFRELFDIAAALSFNQVKKKTYLVYYTRDHDKGVVRRRCAVIDLSLCPDFESWEKGGKPQKTTIPGYRFFSEKK